MRIVKFCKYLSKIWKVSFYHNVGAFTFHGVMFLSNLMAIFFNLNYEL